MTETRSSLLRRLRDPADQGGWEEFIALYQPLLLAYVRGKGLQEHDARDVVQEIFAKLYRALPDFELDRARGRFRTWLWQVTSNAIADWARARKRQAREEDAFRERLAAQPPEVGAEPDAEWSDSYRKRVLEVVLARVRARSQPNTWACFEQHVLRGRPSAEVAAELALTANAVKVNASRVLAQVREQCAEYMEDLAELSGAMPPHSSDRLSAIGYRPKKSAEDR
jgi:RNA polymerase sigma-70 factor (ECF subfamily)